jgi:hypothetical protein
MQLYDLAQRQAIIAMCIKAMQCEKRPQTSMIGGGGVRVDLITGRLSQ